MSNNLIINDIVKVYPHMLKIVIYHQPYSLPKPSSIKPKRKPGIGDNKNPERSLRRTKSVVKDIILSNSFDYFCTFTFDRRKHNRYDVDHCKLVMSMWLKRQRKHSPDLKYLIVPELHKDGAVHFHALIANYNGNLRLLDKKTKSGQPIYNISSYRAGKISSAVPINDNHEAVANYILKQYITKGMLTLFNKRRYWCSKNLKRPESIVNGVSSLYLSNIIKNKQPDYIDDNLEVQYHATQGAKIDKAGIMFNLPF